MSQIYYTHWDLPPPNVREVEEVRKMVGAEKDQSMLCVCTNLPK